MPGLRRRTPCGTRSRGRPDRPAQPHIFQPLLYQVATAVLAPAEIAAPIRQLEVKQRNLSVLLADVTGVSLADRTVDASCPGARVREVAFDFLVVATEGETIELATLLT